MPKQIAHCSMTLSVCHCRRAGLASAAGWVAALVTASACGGKVRKGPLPTLLRQPEDSIERDVDGVSEGRAGVSRRARASRPARLHVLPSRERPLSLRPLSLRPLSLRPLSLRPRRAGPGEPALCSPSPLMLGRCRRQPVMAAARRRPPVPRPSRGECTLFLVRSLRGTWGRHAVPSRPRRCTGA